MDYLPYADNAYYPAVRVPYFIGANSLRYDDQDFPNFASQADGSAWFDCDARTAAERAQIWLYFGLLREMIGDVFQESDIVNTTVEGTSFLNTAGKLPNLLRRWSGAHRWRVLEFLFRFSLSTFVSVCSGGLLVIVFRTQRFKQYIRPSPKLSAESISVLREVEVQIQCLERKHIHSSNVALTCLAVRALLWSVRNAAVNKAPDVFKRSRLELSPDPFLRRTLLERGFCPYELSSMQKTCSIAAVHYVSAYRYDKAAHRGCSGDRCNAYILTQGEYRTKHLDDDCQCDLVRADLGKMKGIIESGQVPIIHASVTTGNVRLDVRPVHPSTKGEYHRCKNSSTELCKRLAYDFASEQ